MTNLEDHFISIECTMFDAMRIIDKAASQVALVVDDKGKLIGTLTDGDVRRGLLNGHKFETTVRELMNREFRYVHAGDEKSEVLEMMRREELSQIPVLDDDGRVVKLLRLQEFLNPIKLPNSIVIMAGGKGERLRPHTETCPKPMLPVDGKPILEILLDQCIKSGFSNFYFSVNYLKDQIIEYFGDGSRWGVSIQYLIETNPLGTAGSLSLMPKSIGEPFLVLNGDILTRLDIKNLLRFHYDHKGMATLCVREHETVIPFGVVETKGVTLSGFIEKPAYQYQVNAGVYVIDPRLLSLLPENQFIDMPSFLLLAQKSGYDITVCPIHEYWLDIGRPDSLKQAYKEWSCQLDA